MLTPWKEVMTHLDSIFKSRDITSPTNVSLVKAMIFPVIIYRCQSWTIKKAEHQRMDTFELWCWRILLSPLDRKEIQPVSPKGNQLWIFTGRSDAEAEAPIFWSPEARSRPSFLNWKRLWYWERLRAEEEDDRRWDGWMASPTQWIWVWANSGKQWRTGKAWCASVCGGHKESDRT